MAPAGGVNDSMGLADGVNGCIVLADVDKGYQALAGGVNDSMELADGVNSWIVLTDVDKEYQALTGVVTDSMTMKGGIKGYIASKGCVKSYMRMPNAWKWFLCKKVSKKAKFFYVQCCWKIENLREKSSKNCGFFIFIILGFLTFLDNIKTFCPANLPFLACLTLSSKAVIF